MPSYTVTAAFYDAWNEVTVTVKAEEPAAACRPVVGACDGPYADLFRPKAFKPMPVFIAGIVESPADWQGQLRVRDGVAERGCVPLQFTEEYAMGQLGPWCETLRACRHFASEIGAVTDRTVYLDFAKDLIAKIDRLIGPEVTP